MARAEMPLYIALIDACDTRLAHGSVPWDACA
jgi:hypothetical protein